MKSGLISKGTFAVAALTVAVLAVLPSTSVTVRQHLRLGFGGGIFTLGLPPADDTQERQAAQRTAARAPQNFTLQFANALIQTPTRSDDSKPDLDRLAALSDVATQFSQEPAVCAAYLRSAGEGGPGRDLEQELFKYDSLDEARVEREKRLQGKPALGYWKAHPDFVARYAAVAKQGVALDPDNGYFHFSRAAAYLSQKQDANAEKELNRAAKAPYWREYVDTESRALIALKTAQQGPLLSLNRVAIASAQSYPQEIFDRSVSRIFVAQAIVAEQSGDTARGFQIRHDLARVGALLRRDTTTNIGFYTAKAIVQNTTTRPGGSSPLKTTVAGFSKLSSTERIELTRGAYFNYLSRNGHADESAWLTKEFAQQNKAQSILQRGMDRSWLGGPSVLWSITWMAACYILLTNLLWMLLAGGISSWVARGPRIRDAAPLHHATRVALGVVTGAVPLGVALALFFRDTAPTAGDVALGIFAMLAWMGMPLLFLWRSPLGKRREMSRDQRVSEARRSLKIYGKTVAQCTTVLMLVAGTLPALVVGPLASLTLLQSLRTNVGSGPDPIRSAAGLLLALSLAMGSIWFGVLIISAVRSVQRRVPASVEIVLAFRRVALPLASLLLFTYAAAAVQATRVDNASTEEINQNIVHEGRFCASLLGETWPDLVSEKVKP